MWRYHDKSALRDRRNFYKDVEKVAVLPLVLGYISSCSKRGTINSKRWPKTSTGRRNFSRNFLGFFDLEQPSFLKLPKSTEYLTSQELVEFLFSRRRHVFTLQFVFLKSYSVCLQVTCDLYFALVIYKLHSCKNTSRTLVKVLLNWILTIFYACSATPVIRSRTFVIWTCNDFY